MYMKATAEMKKYKSGKCLAIHVDSKNKVNKLMITLADAGFIVNYEPRYISGNYEGCFLYDSESAIKICGKAQVKSRKGKSSCQTIKKQKQPVI